MIDQADDDANWEAYEKWKAGRTEQPNTGEWTSPAFSRAVEEMNAAFVLAMLHSDCPDDGACLVDASTGHTTAF